MHAPGSFTLIASHSTPSEWCARERRQQYAQRFGQSLNNRNSISPSPAGLNYCLQSQTHHHNRNKFCTTYTATTVSPQTQNRSERLKLALHSRSRLTQPTFKAPGFTSASTNRMHRSSWSQPRFTGSTTDRRITLITRCARHLPADASAVADKSSQICDISVKCVQFVRNS